MKESIIHTDNSSKIVSDGLLVPPMAFTPLSETLSDAYLKDIGNSGIELFFLVCDLPWLNQPELDVGSLNARLLELENCVPGAKVILRVNMHPPLNWMQENPDELIRLADGQLLQTNFLSCYYLNENKNIPVYSLVSQKWRDDAGEELKKLIEIVTKMPAGDSVMGYFLAAGGTGEWFYLGLEESIDHSLAFKKHFSKWLQKKYGTIENLRHAWRDDQIDFDTIPIPEFEERSAYNCLNKTMTSYAEGGFINPETAFSSIDFYLALHHGICESIEYFCRIIKDNSGDKLLTGAFHGSVDQVGIRKILLESKYVDILATPGIYTNRKPGEITDIRCMSESCALNKKLFFMEDDTRTHLASDIIKSGYNTHTLDDTLTQMKRDFGRNLCRNLYGWWFDMYMPPASVMAGYDRSALEHGGTWWYNSPEILALMEKQQKIIRQALNSDCRRDSDIAVIMDENSTIFGSRDYWQNAVYWRSSELSRIGAPVDFYYQDDLNNPDMPDYKLYIFVNTFMLNDEARKRIKKKVCRNDSTVIWMYAAGICNPDGDKQFSSENIECLTGIKMRYVPDMIDTKFYISNSDSASIKGCDPKIDQGRISREIFLTPTTEILNSDTENYQVPNFYPEDNNAEVLGRFYINELPAITCRNFENWRSIYCATQFIGSDLLRSIARNSGCHIVCNSDDFIFMNRSYMTIHAASDGKKTFKLPCYSAPQEIYSDKKYGTRISEFQVDMKFGETLTFRLKQNSDSK